MTGLPFGYVLVHKDTYAVMLAALEGRVAVASENVTAGSLPASGEPETVGHTQRGTAATESAPVTLSPAILDACKQYAYGMPEEEAINRRQALSWVAAGWTEAEVVQGIRVGGAPVVIS